MPTYKLTYFDVKGLGESIRMLLSYLGKEFEDNRLQMADWPSVKGSIKYGKVPVLEIDGKPLYQSQAICRYLAKEAKLAGDSDWEAAQIDVIAGSISDLLGMIVPVWRISDPKEKEEFINKLKEDQVPYYLNIWNEEAGKGNGFLANGKLSWADFFFHGWFETVEALLKDNILDSYPHLKAGKEKVFSLPGVKDWIAKRPETM